MNYIPMTTIIKLEVKMSPPGYSAEMHLPLHHTVFFKKSCVLGANREDCPRGDEGRGKRGAGGAGEVKGGCEDDTQDVQKCK